MRPAALMRGPMGVLQDGLDARTRFLVELLQAEVGQHAVFARDGHDVGGDAHGEEVEQLIHFFDSAVALHREGGDQLEAHATARELVVRIVAVGALGVEHSHGIGDDIASAVVVADDEVDAFGVGVFDAFHGLDAAVEGDDKLEAVVSRIVDTFVGDAVAFLVAVGDIELDFLLFEEALQVSVNHRHGCRAVHVVVAVDQHLLAIVDGADDPFHGFVHVLHEEGIVELGEGRTEECFGLLVVCNSALDKQSGKVLIDIEHLDNFGNLLFVNRLV